MSIYTYKQYNNNVRIAADTNELQLQYTNSYISLNSTA